MATISCSAKIERQDELSLKQASRSNFAMQSRQGPSYQVGTANWASLAGYKQWYDAIGMYPLLQEVSSFLTVNPSALSEDSGLFQQSLAAFVACNEDPASSPNFKSKVPDLPGPLLQLLRHGTASKDTALVLLLLKVGARLLIVPLKGTADAYHILQRAVDF